MYGFRHCDYVLERLENHGRREAVPLDDLTVDHVMPQGERLHILERNRTMTRKSIRHFAAP